LKLKAYFKLLQFQVECEKQAGDKKNWLKIRYHWTCEPNDDKTVL
jgi:hypothetical protein